MTYNQRLDLIKDYEEHRARLKELVRLVNSDIHALRHGSEKKRFVAKAKLTHIEISKIEQDIRAIRQKL